MKRSVLVIGVLLGLSSPSAWAAGEISLGLPSYQGEGCPSGTVSATLSPDSSALSILFDRFIAEAGQAAGTRLGRAVCRMQVPLRVLPGFRAAITRADYRGFLSMPLRGYAQLTVDFGIGGKMNPRFYRRFVGPIDDNFNASQIVHLRDYQWTPCSSQPLQTRLDLMAGMVAATNERNELVIAAIDSQDLSSGIEYQIRVERCR